MDWTKYQNLLDHISRYVALLEEEVEHLHLSTTVLQFPKKAYLLREGQICSEIFFIQRGLVRSYFVTDKGVEQTTQFSVEDWWITDYLAFQNRTLSQFSIQAVENTEVISISFSAFNNLLETVPVFEKYFRIMFQKALAAQQLRNKYLLSLSGEAFYKIFTHAQPEFTQRIPQYMLASYLGITPEFLSKIRAKKS